MAMSASSRALRTSLTGPATRCRGSGLRRLPMELMTKSEGVALREAWRQFLRATIARSHSSSRDGLTAKLDTTGLSIGFEALQAIDIRRRARALQSMTGGGLEVDRATQGRRPRLGEIAALAGLSQVALDRYTGHLGHCTAPLSGGDAQVVCLLLGQCHLHFYAVLSVIHAADYTRNRARMSARRG